MLKSMDASVKRFLVPLKQGIDIHHKTNGIEKKNYHLHRQMELVYVLSDNLFCSFEQNGEKVRIPSHSILLLDTMTLHFLSTEPVNTTCNRYVLTFFPEHLMDLQISELNLLECFSQRRSIMEQIVPVPEDSRAGYEGILNAMCRACDNVAGNVDTSENSLVLKLGLAHLLVETRRLHRENLKKLDVPVDSDYLAMSRLGSEIKAFIKQNACLRLSVEEICSQFLIDKDKLYRLFDKLYGMTVAQFRIHCRMARAKDFLLNTSLPVEIISEKTGYRHLSSFSRCFRRETGTTPLRFRSSSN